jgi:predicted RNA binding protein YcfA (HicA-like mRNA interferase family)
MPRRLSQADLERTLAANGFRLVRQSGSHRVWRAVSGKIVVVPAHGNKMNTGTARRIVRESGLPPERFLRD